jgi:subtilisin family serine protease
MSRHHRRAGVLAALCAVSALAIGVPAMDEPAAGAPARATVPGPSNAPEYWFDQWHVPQLWADGARGQGITIAEIDTGVNGALPELRGRILPGKDFGQTGNGEVDRDLKRFGHGTAMASIMVARPGAADITGLAPDAKVLPVAVPLIGTTDASPDDHLAAAIRWSVNHGAKIISMSLGGARTRTANGTACPADEQAAIYYALRRGAVLLAASGNRGGSDNAVEEPGVCLGVISVGAVGRTGQVAAFSSRHPYLTLVAPGVRVPSLSRVAGKAYWGDGTSQATAIASAAIALVWSKYPGLTGREVVTRVLSTLNRHGSGHTDAYGYGALDAHDAVLGAIPAGATNPVYTTVVPFLSRVGALGSTQIAKPRAAAAASKPPGTFAIGTPPRLLTRQVVTGLVIALAGLAVLLALSTAAFVRRRAAGRTRAKRPGLRPPPVVVDDSGLEWHEILLSD